MPKTTASELTSSVEDYLKAIYQLSGSDKSASTNDIAHELGLAAPSVSGMMKRLAEQGLIKHLPYKGATLTRAGRTAALRMIRRHRLIEAYLVKLLGYTWDTVHEEAERLEHAVSDDLVERMADALGDPRFDPHGDPIPTADGRIEAVATVPLPELAVGERGQINRVDSASPEKLRWLAEAGLVPGAVVTMLAQQPFDGPVTIDVGGNERIVGHDLGRQLLCVRGGAS